MSIKKKEILEFVEEQVISVVDRGRDWHVVWLPIFAVSNETDACVSWGSTFESAVINAINEAKGYR